MHEAKIAARETAVYDGGCGEIFVLLYAYCKMLHKDPKKYISTPLKIA
ncbi:hypothetical protein [Asaia bogorensis]